MGKVFGILRQTVLAESRHFLAGPTEEKEDAMKRKRMWLQERLSAWDRPHGLVGLHNIGRTCCLNALIQVLIMNMRFTKILKRITLPREEEEQKHSVPVQLLLLMERMQDSRQKAVRPVELAYCLRKCNVPLSVQHDAAYLYLTILNLIKDQITDADLVERLQRLYGIQMKESLICLECNKESSQYSNMFTLPLSLFDLDCKPLKTLEDAFRYFLQPKELIGESKFFCENCGRKTSRKQAGGQYELFAVIAHVGMADFGHYCAYIQNSGNGEWFCFNDSNVCWVSWEDIRCTYGSCHYRWQETAYILVYSKTES
ncbi:PREDICTED: ubl carboxyl-terminal hydrolase 18 isoform X3 [Condylura cristata]|uniref:ubl carboxyl-terminal hydrolase 18 isoform X3 n=1 Tax=Condylura cristata TaxID=143302 RepID=UPI0006439B32|nr:PREDICTED: ubl carboxyl-terminal hydrolase 18 isoform X3 [Condylura cristata]